MVSPANCLCTPGRRDFTGSVQGTTGFCSPRFDIGFPFAIFVAASSLRLGCTNADALGVSVAVPHPLLMLDHIVSECGFRLV